MCFLVLASSIAWNDWDLVCLVEHRRYWDVIWLGCFRKATNPDVSWLNCEPNRIAENGVLGLITHRIHGAGIYMLYSSTMDPMGNEATSMWQFRQPKLMVGPCRACGWWVFQGQMISSFRQGLGNSWLEFFSWTFTGWGPIVISWFINHINYSYKYHKR